MESNQKSLTAKFKVFYYLVLLFGTGEMLAWIDDFIRSAEHRSHFGFLAWMILNLGLVMSGWCFPLLLARGRIPKVYLQRVMVAMIISVIAVHTLGVMAALMLI